MIVKDIDGQETNAERFEIHIEESKDASTITPDAVLYGFYTYTIDTTYIVTLTPYQEIKCIIHRRKATTENLLDLLVIKNQLENIQKEIDNAITIYEKFIAKNCGNLHYDRIRLIKYLKGYALPETDEALLKGDPEYNIIGYTELSPELQKILIEMNSRQKENSENPSKYKLVEAWEMDGIACGRVAKGDWFHYDPKNAIY